MNPAHDIEDVEIIKETKIDSGNPPVFENSKRINIGFELPNTPGQEVTDPRLIDILNGLSAGAVKSPIAEMTPTTSTVRLNQFKSILGKYNINAKALTKFVWLINNQPDPMSLATVDEPTNGPVSPMILAATRDMKFFKLMKSIKLYNVVMYFKDVETWGYLFKTSDGRLDRIDIKRNEYERRITFEEGFGLALATHLLNTN